MVDHFSSPKRRIARAKEHLDELERQGRAYFDSEPYDTVVETDPDSGDQLYKVKITTPPPDSLTDLTVECVEALRSALDLAAFATASLAGRPKAKSACFPIADTAANLENAIKGRCKDLPPNIVAFFRSLKPYKEGNYPIWALNKICNSSKHKLISPVVLRAGEMKIKTMTMSHGNFHIPVWDHEKNEIIFGIVRPEGKFQYDFDLTHFIAFWKVETVEGEPVIPILDNMSREVEDIVLGTEAEAQ